MHINSHNAEFDKGLQICPICGSKTLSLQNIQTKETRAASFDKWVYTASTNIDYILFSCFSCHCVIKHEVEDTDDSLNRINFEDNYFSKEMTERNK